MTAAAPRPPRLVLDNVICCFEFSAKCHGLMKIYDGIFDIITCSKSKAANPGAKATAAFLGHSKLLCYLNLIISLVALSISNFEVHC